jgi:hypothetical protein
MTIKLEGDSGGSNLRRFQWTADAVRWADITGPKVRTALKAAAPVAKGPGGGRLRDSIRFERKTSTGSISMIFTGNTPYTGYVIRGTPPHLIRPRAAKALRWSVPGGSRFALIVHHPGTKPNPFPERAIRPMIPAIQHRFATIVQDSMRG